MEYITKNREREDEGGLEGSQSAKMLDGNIIERGSVIDLTYHSGYNSTEETLVLYCIFFFYALADTFIQSEIQVIQQAENKSSSILARQEHPWAHSAILRTVTLFPNSLFII